MKLELSFFIVTAVVNCVLFLIRDDGAAPYSKERETSFFKFTAVSVLSAVISSATAMCAVYLIPQSAYLLPLVSLITAVIMTSLLQKLRFFSYTERFNCELMLVTSVLLMFLVFGVTEDINAAFIYLGVSTALFIVSSVLLYFTVIRFACYDGKKQPLFLASASICASSLGFAAEGFKGILEKLFT